MERQNKGWQTVSTCNNENKWMMNGWKEWEDEGVSENNHSRRNEKKGAK